MRQTLLFWLHLALFVLAAPAQEAASRWDLMTSHEIGADRFRASHPEFDGRGVVIAVLDTGVDMGVKGLTVLPHGRPKVVDARDFSTEGDLYWEEAHIKSVAKGETITDRQGRSLTHFREAVKGATSKRFHLAWIEEKNFVDCKVKDLNADGDSTDVFGVLVFTSNDDQGKPRYVAVVDVNGDGRLDDGVCVSDYWRDQETFCIRGARGARRQLTFAANFHPAEKRLSLHFDADGHGTHVAGIAAGYEIHGQAGYHGVAPGARIISLKIGNNRLAGGATVTESIKKALDFGVAYARKHCVPVVFNMSFGIASEIESKSAVDRYVDSMLAANPGVVFVTAAGNEGPGLSSVGTPAAALRAITVGALLSPEAARAQYGCPLEYETVFEFSSRGGDLFKPDIVAPGSAASTVPLWGDQDHFHGTSMASPSACGGIALLVDALVRDENRYPIDNALILRAVKMTARGVPGLGMLDQGGGALDIPAAYAHARSLYQAGEHRILRRYRVVNRGPARGIDCVYWREAPALPRKTDVMNVEVASEFVADAGGEARARFYRAFDLVADADWIQLTRTIAYLKGPRPARLGIMVDVEGKPPGLYCASVRAFRKGRSGGMSRVPEFVVPVSILVPQRVDAANRGRFHLSGELAPGRFRRHFFEVPAGVQAVTWRLRLLERGQPAMIVASLVDPDGMSIGGLFVTDADGRSEGNRISADGLMVPGVWEMVVGSSMRSRVTAKWDLTITMTGLTIGDPVPFAAGEKAPRPQVMIPVRCTQPGPFRGQVQARIDRFVKQEVVEVEGTDRFDREVRLGGKAGTARWQIAFDRETYALMTDCVVRVIDLRTGETVCNEAFVNRTQSVSVTVPEDAKGAVPYRLRLQPAFALAKDRKRWRFVLTEELIWSSPPAALELVGPDSDWLALRPTDWKNLIFRLPGTLPEAPPGYRLGGLVRFKSGGQDGRWTSTRLSM